MTKINISILNEHGTSRHSSSEKELVFWDGFGSIAIAETLRALMHPFGSEQVSIRIIRDIDRPFESADCPAALYMIWKVAVTLDRTRILSGFIMIHRAFPDRNSRCALCYTLSGARKLHQFVRKKTSR